MTNFETYCDKYYLKTGFKFHWYLKSCCHDITSTNESIDFNDFKSSTTLDDADIVIVGTKIGKVDFEKITNVFDKEKKKFIFFGNCAFDGGIFPNDENRQKIFNLDPKNTLFIPGCPPSFNQFSLFFENFLKGEN